MLKLIITSVLLMTLCIFTGHAYTNLITHKDQTFEYNPEIVNKDTMLTKDYVRIVKIGHDYCYVFGNAMSIAVSCEHSKSRIQKNWLDRFIKE